MSRSLIRQLEQIRRSATYNDAVSNVYTAGVAEPTVSGSLEQDLNVLRTLMKELKGTTDWFGDLGNYFDPTNTDAGNSENKDLNFSNIKNNTLDAKTVILAVVDDNSGSGYTVSGTSTGVLVSTSTSYATASNRTGLPIFASTANNGSYFDEGGLDRVCRADIIDINTGTEMQNSSGQTIYAKLHDGSDFSGSGSGTDVYVRFYANGAVTDLSDVQGGAPSSIKLVYPYRKRMSDMAEHEWLRTDFVSSWEGDVELIEDIQNLWAFTGASDNDGSSRPWDNITANFALNANPTNLKDAVDDLNDVIGDRTYTSQYSISDASTVATALDALDLAVGSQSFTNQYTVTNDESVTSSLDALDLIIGDMDFTGHNHVSSATNVTDAISALDQAIADTSGAKYVETVGVAITKNVAHTLPNSLTYTPDATSGQEGANMDVYIDGQLLAADTGASGVNADRDYAEASSSTITFRFDIQAGRNITYIIRK